MEIMNSAATPFLKWAGGKRWLWRQHREIFQVDYAKYFEPFLGGGAIFLGLQPHSAVLSDSNEDLVNVYLQLRDHWQAVRNRLKVHHENHCRDYYYEVRSTVAGDALTRAARFLYLNRTCWNGLYRVNLAGEFNVPMGTKSDVFVESEDFAAVSRILKRATIMKSDFSDAMKLVGERDLVYVDPPYTVNHNSNGFLKYNEKIFSWADQERLAESVRSAADRGARIIVSQANHESIRELYAGLGEIGVVRRASVLAADSSKRGQTTELLIRINL